MGNKVSGEGGTSICGLGLSAYSNQVEGLNMIVLKFKRDRLIGKNCEVNKLECECEKALSAIGSLKRKNSAYTTGTAVGAGIIGAGILGLAYYSFITMNTIMGVLLSGLGVIGMGVGFFAYKMVEKRKAMKTTPMVQEYLNTAFSACEQAHALLA